MKPFDLEKALAGEPAMLRDHTKAYVKYEIDDSSLSYLSSTDKVHGYYVEPNGKVGGFLSWDKNGVYQYQKNSPVESDEDIIGMWEEPTPTVTLELPCPPENVEDRKFGIFISDVYCRRLTKDIYFAKREDIEEWVRALSNLLTIKKEQEIKELENATTN